MESTWEKRDLPVLDTVVRLLDEGHFIVAVRDIVAETGYDPATVDRALTALEGPFIAEYHQSMSGGDPNPWYVTQVTAEARRMVGQWPTPEALIDRLAEAFGEAAEHETDPQKQGRLREVATMIGQTGRDIAVEVASRVILHQTGMG